MKELIAVQNELKAPKNLFNSFGKYHYRNLEGILEGVKPLLNKYKCTMTISDSVENIGGANFVKATITITNESGERIENSAYAQIDVHKGMSMDQCVGTASSYARKYCANGLFLIDDTKDTDTDEFKIEKKAKLQKAEEQTPNDSDYANIKKMLELTNSDVKAFLKYFGVKAVEEMSMEQIEQANDMLTRKTK